MRLDILPIGQFEENSYVLHDNGHVLFVDPGRYYKKIMECVGKNEIVDGILLTHGHSDHTGAVDYLCYVYNCPVYILFTGDTLFASSCGRTDLYSGSDEKMRHTLEYLKTLPHDLQIYPGHGPASTIGIEVRNNPYMISYF